MIESEGFVYLELSSPVDDTDKQESYNKRAKPAIGQFLQGGLPCLTGLATSLTYFITFVIGLRLVGGKAL